MSNTITAYFKGRVGVAESVYQNDYGIVMAFDSIDLPAHFDCYFSRLNQEEALPGLGADNRVTIPNSILANPGNVTIHIPLHTGEDDSEVEYVIYFKVIGRARPIDDGTPTQMTAIERALALLSQPITNIEEIVNEALSFTGDTFAEMKAELQEDFDNYTETLEGDLATWKGGVESDIDDVEADFAVLQGQFDTAVAAVTTDTEVTDIRVGADGVTDTTAGASVRRQFTDVKSALRAKEVSTWNMWDGSWGASNKNPLGTSYPYIVYSPSIPVTEGEYYSIGIVANALPLKVNVVSVRFYSESASVGSAHSIWKNGGYLDWVQAPTGATRASVFFNTNDASIPLTPTEFLQARFKVVFAHRLVNNSPRDNTGRYIFTADEWIPSYLWDTKSINNVRTNIVTVGASGSNFTSLRDAIDTINSYGGASETNRFEVRIKEGTYDISSYYTSAEKAQSGFVGLTVPDWVTLKGVGNREKTILKYELETASTNICVLNLMNTCGLENLTLYGVKTRYCVHDDKANYIGTPYKRYCKNVHFKGDTMTLGAVYGAGINSNAEWIFEDCIFESLTETNYQNCFSVHGSGQQVQVGSSSVLFDNCRFIGHGSSLNNALILSTLMNNASYFQNYCKLKGCSANGRLILREENASSYGAGIAWWATGYATTFTDVVISNTDGVDYSENVDII